MSCNRFAATIAAMFLCVSSASAQDADGKITLELNKATTVDETKCQVVFFGQNGLEQELDQLTLSLAVFDGEGVFKNLLSLRLGNLIAGKRRVLQFNLPTSCADMSEIVINDVTACTISGASDAENSDVCLNELNVSSRTDIAFGL